MTTPRKSKAMSDSEADELRCIAHEIIIKLMNAGKRQQLNLLEMHATSAAAKLDNEGIDE